MKIIKGDEIIVTLGKDKGKEGKVEKVFPKNMKIVVPGINQFKRHKKARVQGQKSDIVTIVKPIDVAKVALKCPKCHKATRVGFLIEKGKKVRICRKCKAKL